jgi:hypothetical protein
MISGTADHLLRSDPRMIAVRYSYRFPWLEGWPHDLESGWYCPAHADHEAAERRMRLGRRRRPVLT